MIMNIEVNKMNADEFLLTCAELCPTEAQELIWEMFMEDEGIKRNKWRNEI